MPTRSVCDLSLGPHPTVRLREGPACSIQTHAKDSTVHLGVQTVAYVPGNGKNPCDADKSPWKASEVWDFS